MLNIFSFENIFRNICKKYLMTALDINIFKKVLEYSKFNI